MSQIDDGDWLQATWPEPVSRAEWEKRFMEESDLPFLTKSVVLALNTFYGPPRRPADLDQLAESTGLTLRTIRGCLRAATESGWIAALYTPVLPPAPPVEPGQ